LGASRPAERGHVAALYGTVRDRTEFLARPLSAEDQTVQSMPDASPAKWHRAHTTWFFETMVLGAHSHRYSPYHPQYGYIFNSYYDAAGARHPRDQRGLLTRPTCADVTAYRSAVDARMIEFMGGCSDTIWRAAAPLITLGINHEQQHQELLLTDILHAFSCNPLRPAYQTVTPQKPPGISGTPEWIAFPREVYEIGTNARDFAFDNEGPRHRVALEAFALSTRPVSNNEWMAFIEDGGYSRPEFWLSDGWSYAAQNGWNAPLYWSSDGADWKRFSLAGLQPLDDAAPVSHVSFYEADAYARWAGKRLPTEAEWEIAASTVPPVGNFQESGLLDPQPADGPGLAQMFGDVWEWTQSAYAPYPGFKADAGAVGEYNGKFMINQLVLRGGSCLTPRSHIRGTYRNFFHPHARWQFTGLRLADTI
jgi:ergothioneine biosynthesis protein EgtB